MKFNVISASVALLLASFAAQAQNIVPKADPSAWENPTGKYEVVMEEDETLPDHTIYRPVDLSEFPNNDNLPIIVMSGPGCDFDGDSYRPFWTELASHGYLVVAVGKPVPEGTRAPMFYNKAKDLMSGLNWAFKENERKESKYYGKIDTANVVLMGQSCGGQLVSKIALDSRVTLIALFNSGMIPFESPRSAASNPRDNRIKTSDPEMTGNPIFYDGLKVPIAFFVGENDMLRPNSLHDFNSLEKTPAVYAVRDIPGDAHGGTFREKNGGAWGEAGVAWVNWWCKNDIEAAMLFRGAPSGLEKSSEKWIEVRKKNIDHTSGTNDMPTDWADMRRYERANDTLACTPEVVLMGDSITDYWVTSDADFFTKNNFAGRGIAGQTVSQMLVRFDQDVLQLKPKAVVIMAGTNDICQQMASMNYYPDANIINNTIAMCELALNKGIQVLLCSITPCEHYMPIRDLDAGSKIVEINKELKAYADSRKGVTYVDYFTPLANEKNGFDPEMSYDGVHPTIYCYSFMEPILTDAIAKALKKKNTYWTIPQDEALELKKAEDARRAAARPMGTRR